MRYVLEGSVRKAANRLRITGQLIDALSGTHIWADRFDGPLEDVFALQDGVTASVVGAIAPQVEQAEIERARSKAAGASRPMTYYLRAIAGTRTRSDRNEFRGLAFCSASRRIDPTYARALAPCACCFLVSSRRAGHRATTSQVSDLLAGR